MLLKTTKKQFKLFKKEAQKWIEFYGLKSWTVTFFHIELRNSSCAASCSWTPADKTVSIGLNICVDVDSDESITDELIRRWAFHEVNHLLLANLYSIATHRFIQTSDVDEEVHAILAILENSFFK